MQGGYHLAECCLASVVSLNNRVLITVFYRRQHHSKNGGGEAENTNQALRIALFMDKGYFHREGGEATTRQYSTTTMWKG